MNDEERKPTFKELWDSARQGMIFRNTPIRDKIDKYSTLTQWIKEEDITQGMFAVRAAAIYDNYIKWCKERQINTSILSMTAFGIYFKQHFKAQEFDNVQHYYINKEMAEDEEARKIRKEKHRPKKLKKTEVVGSGETDVQ